jgi:hypothetical protein
MRSAWSRSQVERLDSCWGLFFDPEGSVDIFLQGIRLVQRAAWRYMAEYRTLKTELMELFAITAIRTLNQNNSVLFRVVPISLIPRNSK